MSRRSGTVARLAFLAILLSATVAVGHSYATATGVADGASAGAASPSTPESSSPSDAPTVSTSGRTVDVESRFERASDRPTRGENWSTARVTEAVSTFDRNVTVVATQGFYVSDERAELAAFLPNGTVVYYDDRYRVYFDVDPVEDERYTVEYVAAEHLTGDVCTPVGGEPCTRNVVVRVNLTTGDERTVYSEVTERVYSARWHDVDRINETHLLVADIVDDGVYAVDTRDGSVAWRWNATAHYDRDQGGSEGDWTHVNDVEYLADGSVMVSPRNMDEVIFLERGPDGWAVAERRTLGTDENHSVLYEQHNPDYIPAERGGPAVLVADSENGRVVEYQRTADGWTRTWQWRDVRLQWPRDADRLPDGGTLVVDSHGDRVAEVGVNDTVVWSADVGMPYDVERLGTGDESAGGPAAPYRAVVSDRSGNATSVVANVTDESARSGSGQHRSLVDRFWLGLKALVPSLVANGALYVAPSWVRFSDLVFATTAVSTGVVWSISEFYWSEYSLAGLARRATAVGRRALAAIRRP
ncbi:aryl-sulfate sulfotransferase [Halomicroarcula sp. F13]|uniref:Aryl-sulfate sulfotransferase n=1 Tax=Haloarcula rubra TaxID=2487747 RepID=A0AAW4PSF4_9EURY|nr:aryl-sulfate sulfotransferase [Halomicroarcula rubra]MBX0323323.1 aryl-sulfate sulfotransferase [Halomicroarcula rubra]